VADPPSGLTATMSGHFVQLNWTVPNFGQVQTYTIWRAVGSIPANQLVAKSSSFVQLPYTATRIGKTLPPTTFTDKNVKNNVTYTYFVTAVNIQGAKSGATAPFIFTVKF
jgi:hypothetical protein